MHQKPVIYNLQNKHLLLPFFTPYYDEIYIYSITFSLSLSLQFNFKLYLGSGPLSGTDPDPDPKSEREISVNESPLDDLLDEGFRTEPSSEFFDFLRGFVPVGGTSDDSEPWFEPWFEPRRCRLCRDPPDDSCTEESADGSEDRWWRRVCFLIVLDSLSIDWCLDLGIKCRILDPFGFVCSAKHIKIVI